MEQGGGHAFRGRGGCSEGAATDESQICSLQMSRTIIFLIFARQSTAYHINFSYTSRAITSSLTHSRNAIYFSSLVLEGEAMSNFRADELISGRSICSTLLSAGNFSVKNSYPFLWKTTKAFYCTNFSALPQRCSVWRISAPTTKQNLVSIYFFLSSLSRSQVWMGFCMDLLSWISSSATLICGCFWKMVRMSWKRFSMGRSSFLSSRSPQGISQTQSMPSIFPRCWMSFRWPRCGGSKAPPYIATFFIIYKLQSFGGTVALHAESDLALIGY